MSREKIMLRVIKGGFIPADDYAIEQLRVRGFRTGDVIQADLVKPRNSQFNRLVHAIGKMVSQQIEGFPPDAHACLKKIQLEGDIACEHNVITLAGVEAMVRFPKSLSRENMDDGEFHQVAQQMCAYIAEKYWPEMEPEQVQAMAETFIE